MKSSDGFALKYRRDTKKGMIVMSFEMWSAVGTIGTFLVISVTAIAALVQLRHMRGNNQIITFTELRERFESPGFEDALHFVTEVLPLRLADPNLRAELHRNPFVGEYRAISTVATLFEAVGTLARAGIVDKTIACRLWAGKITYSWNALAPVIAYVRHYDRLPGVWENFEYLAVLSKQYLDAHPNGEYPKNTPRMPVDSSLINDSMRSPSTSPSPGLGRRT